MLTLKMHNPGFDRLGMVHCLTLRHCYFGFDPYFGSHWARSTSWPLCEAAATSIINFTPERWWESIVASFPQIHNHFHILCWGCVKHTQVCTFCISEAFNEIKSTHFSNAWRYSSLCVISCIGQSVAQKLDKIHVFYARKFCRPTSGVCAVSKVATGFFECVLVYIRSA